MSCMKCECMSCMKCESKCPYSKRPILHPKIPGCTPVIFNLTFHPNFHLNILVFANLPIYRKLLHDKMSLLIWKPKIFYLVLFWRIYKILFVHTNIRILETLVRVILKKIYIILFINIGIIMFVSVILKKIKIVFIPIYLRCCKNSHRI